MAGPLRTPLLLLAALALTLALAVAVSPETNRRNPKSALVGGASDADVNEEGVQQALNFALSEYNKASNDAYHSRAMRVVRARKQPATLHCDTGWHHNSLGKVTAEGSWDLLVVPPGRVWDELLLGGGDRTNQMYQVPAQLGQLSLS
ncbi:cystatin-C isoform X2 [Halichoerus grypus]|uniref:cystatin-C isoform X3 n=1 Tax=Halichoerus grypus TaxID=9711 RepID=UPI0016598E11|nr:cystatin-C isoform X3 [Halichoerus grypus]